MRPDWDEYALRLAAVVSLRATCPRRSVGAVILDSDKRLVSSGYNGSPAGEAHCTDAGCRVIDGHCRRTLHAEANAVLAAWERGLSLADCSIAVTAQPCAQCMSLLASAGITRVLFAEGYADALAVRIAKAAGIELSCA